MRTMRVTNNPESLVPVGAHAAVTVSSTALLGATVVALDGVPEYVQVQVTAQPVRLTLDGATAPVAATTGFLLAAGTLLVMGRAQWLNSRWIREGTDAVLQVQRMGVG